MENLQKVITNTFKSLESAQQDFQIGIESVGSLVDELVEENKVLKRTVDNLETIIKTFLTHEKNK